MRYAFAAFTICVHLCASVVSSALPEPRFEPQTIDAAIKIGYGVAVGEVDGDGKPDVIVADAKQIVWYANPGKPGEPWAKHVMAENLTALDNVCLAVRDIDGDGKVEVAVGAQWNPGETTDPEKSGAVFYLIRPADPTQKWEPVQIKPHEPTVHRMAWVRVGEKKYQLAVLPLHGVGNKNGEGAQVNLLIYDVPADPKGEWKLRRVGTGMHLTHNFDVLDNGAGFEGTLYAGREGIAAPTPLEGSAQRGVGEVRNMPLGNDRSYGITTIEPMHGDSIVAYLWGEEARRVTIDSTLREGHALGSADLLGLPRPQIVAGWRMPNAQKKVGIRMYVPLDDKGEKWATHVIDDNKMACEDLTVADLDGDGRLDIVASGRATRNVIVYWNRTDVAKRGE